MTRLMIALIAAVIGFTSPSLAVLPDEVLDDPALEARARELSKDLRCLVCQNQSIDDSNADLARDLRVVVRERLVAGDTDDEIRYYIVERYGEYVLLTPPFNASTFLLWVGPGLIMVAGIAFTVVSFRRVARAHPVDGAVAPDNEQRIADLLDTNPDRDKGPTT